MTVQRGEQTVMTMRRQAAFDALEPAADGAFMKLPFFDMSAGPSQELSEDPEADGDALPDPVVGGIEGFGGGMTVPAGYQSLGWHLSGLFGLPTTTSQGANFSHVFEMGASQTVDLYTVGMDFLQIGVSKRAANVAYSEMTISARKESQRARASFNLVGSGEAKIPAPLDTAPVVYGDDAAPVGYLAEVYEGGAVIGTATALEIRVAKGVAPDNEAMNGLPTPAAILDGKWALTGSISVRLTDAEWYDAAAAGDFKTLELRLVEVAGRSLIMRLHNLRLERTGTPIQGAGIITQTYNFTASRPAAGDTPFRVTLVNDVANYANA